METDNKFIIVIIVLVGVLFATSLQSPSIWVDDGVIRCEDGTVANYPSNCSINVHSEDVHNIWANHNFYREIANYTLAVDAPRGSLNLTLVNATGLTTGDILHLGQTINHEHTSYRVIGVSGNVVSLNRPTDKNHSAGSIIAEIDTDLSSVGATINNPLSYKCVPSYNETWHIKKVQITCVDDKAPDFTKFCGESPLTNGLVFREYDGKTDTFTTFFYGRTNGDFIRGADDFNFLEKTGGGEYTFTAQLYLDRVDVALDLDYNEGDYLEILVQNGTTSVTTLTFSCFGHVEGK